MKTITLYNVKDHLQQVNAIIKSRLYGKHKWRQYVLLQDVHVELSNKKLYVIPSGFRWDLSSVPRPFWAILPPDGDFEIAALIHDYLYQNQITSRKFADKEMLIWSKAVNGRKGSFRRIDNYTRYYAVRAFGGVVWKNK